MASTYPLEIVQAERWTKDPKNAALKGEQLAAALEKQTWDPSVKSLVPFPQVLQMMSEQLDWTQKLGDAVLAQQKDVMASIQRLRQKAQAADQLKTTEQQVVTTDSQTQTIVIKPANPQVVYVAGLQSHRRLWRLALSRLSALLLSAQPALLPSVRHFSQAWRLRPASPWSDRSGAGAAAIGVAATSTSTSTDTTTSTATTSGEAGRQPCLPIPIAGATIPRIAAAPPIATPARVSNISASVARPRSIRGILAAIPAVRGGTALGQGGNVSRGQGSLGQGSVGQGSRSQGSLQGGASSRQRPGAGAGSGNRGGQYNAFGDFGSQGVDDQPAGQPRRGQPAGLYAALGRGVARRGTRRAAVTLTSLARSTLGMVAAVAAVMLSLAAAAAQLTFPTPDKAFTALIAAARAENTKALIEILGPKGESSVVSGDPVVDQQTPASYSS